jgi:hypothetical protein
MTDFTSITSALTLQAGVCAQMGSPFSGRVLSVVRDDVERGGPFAGFFDAWKGVGVRGLMDEAVSLRILGGLQHLVLSGADAALAAHYPASGAEPDDATLARVLISAAERHHDILLAFMASPPQTNEVRRSICLVGGYLTLAKQTGLPLRCLEIGASAGLNMNWDLYHYDFGAGRTWGDPASPLRLDADWEGPAPLLDAPVVVAEKRGCDQNPIDIADDASVRRLEAYVWPDQLDRLARLRAAIALARATRNSIDKADAAAWVAANARPREGMATVVVHSVVWPYLSPATQGAIADSIRAAGESASASAPFAWLRMEPDPANMAAPMEVRLSVWPGKANRLLARVHPHGAKVIWLGQDI